MTLPSQFVTPVDLDAEDAMIGAVCELTIEPDWDLPPSCLGLVPDDFQRPEARDAWRAILRLIRGGKPVDRLLVIWEGASSAYIAHCIANCVPTPFHLDWYAERVTEMARRRRLIREAHRLAREGYLGEKTTTDPQPRRRGIQV